MAAHAGWVQWQQDRLVIRGELTAETIAQFERELQLPLSLPSQLTVDLSELEILDGSAAVAAVNAMRRLAQGRHLVLHAAPQLLAHNLYRVAALEDSHITLQSMREDEPYG